MAIRSSFRLPRLGLATLLTLAACAGPAPAPESPGVTVALPRAEAAARLDTALRRQGLVTTSGSAGAGPITALGTGPAARGWADCPPLRLEDPASRMNRSASVAAALVTTRVAASLTPEAPDSTRVALRVTHEGGYVNPFTNTPLRAPCPSSGALEADLLATLATGTTGPAQE